MHICNLLMYHFGNNAQPFVVLLQEVVLHIRNLLVYHFGNCYRRLCCCCAYVLFCPNPEMSRLFHYEICGIVTEGCCAYV